MVETRIVRGPLAVRDFRLLWLGESVSIFGTQFHMVAMPWLVLQLTGSGLALGTVLMTSAIPRALLMLAGGALTDRFAPRALMLAANATRGALMVALAALVASSRIALWEVYAIAGTFGAADAFFYPAYTSMAPHLLPPERLASGNALLQGTAQLAALAGPAIGGVTVAATGVAYAFGIDAASFFFSFVMIALITGARAASAVQARHDVLRAIGEGLRYAWGDDVIRAFLLMIAGVNLAFVGPFLVGSAVVAHDVFGGPRALGAMLASFGGGAFVGTVIAGSVKVRRRGWWMIAPGAFIGAGLPAFGFAPNVWAASAVLAAIGATAGLANIVALTFLQTRAEERVLRGRPDRARGGAARARRDQASCASLQRRAHQRRPRAVVHDGGPGGARLSAVRTFLRWTFSVRSHAGPVCRARPPQPRCAWSGPVGPRSRHVHGRLRTAARGESGAVSAGACCSEVIVSPRERNRNVP